MTDPLLAISLDDINTDKGCLQHLFLAETMTPGKNEYNKSEAIRGFKAMKSVLYNRLVLKNRFGAPNGKNIRDIAAAKDQFPEIVKTATGIALIPGFQKIVDDCVAIANNANDPRQTAYKEHIQAAISVSTIPNAEDEFINIKNIKGVATKGGVYGFNKGATGPMGSMIQIPIDAVDTNNVKHSGTILKNIFYTLPKDFSLMVNIETGLWEPASDSLR